MVPAPVRVTVEPAMVAGPLVDGVGDGPGEAEEARTVKAGSP